MKKGTKEEQLFTFFSLELVTLFHPDADVGVALSTTSKKLMSRRYRLFPSPLRLTRSLFTVHLRDLIKKRKT